MAKVSVVVPDVWGEDESQEAVIVNWYYPEGAEVREGDLLAEGMLEKVTFEIRAPVSGRLSRILAPVDATVTTGSVVAEINVE